MAYHRKSVSPKSDQCYESINPWKRWHVFPKTVRPHTEDESRLSEWKCCVCVCIYVYIVAVRFSLAVLPANPLHSLQNERHIETSIDVWNCCSFVYKLSVVIETYNYRMIFGSSCESADTLLILINRLINRSNISHGYWIDIAILNTFFAQLFIYKISKVNRYFLKYTYIWKIEIFNIFFAIKRRIYLFYIIFLSLHLISLHLLFVKNVV